MTRTKQVVVALSLIALGVTGMFGLQALGAPNPATAPLTPAVAAPVGATQVASDTTPQVDPALRQQMLQMMQQNMGLSPAEAEKLVDSMAAHMQAVHGDQASAMADYCGSQQDGQASDSATGTGMMGTTGYGMMGGSNYN